jgi:hypothetical protein
MLLMTQVFHTPIGLLSFLEKLTVPEGFGESYGRRLET